MSNQTKKKQSPHLWVNSVWYGANILSYLLLPLSGVFAVTAKARKWKQCHSKINFPVPVIVVGNITVGGTGKTPMVTALVKNLQRQEFKPGVASRGYGRQATQAVTVEESHSAYYVGDEPLMIFNNTCATVMVGEDRVDVIEKLIKDHQCDVIICDDGVQDYRFEHDIEIIMIDGERAFGNHKLLPAGPLRESIKRLQDADFVVATSKVVPPVSEDCMKLQLSECVSLSDSNNKCSIANFKDQAVHAVAGIGNPNRFFNNLTSLGLKVIEHAYPDHVHYELSDFSFSDQNPILMTEKDAVKCQKLALDNAWYVPVQTVLPDDFMSRVNTLLRDLNG
ncbi:MAG: tetraacyldisaccharide 4'-kinase [Gammaproteobacteria bacterium]|nr:tetraacyldisaccharide 4'-kinase [Gammaproteobacteria bacterium]